MRRLDILLAEAAAKLPGDLLSRIVVFGSAPLAVEEVGIRDDVGDLDLFVSDETFSELERRGFTARVKLRDAKTDEEVLHLVVSGKDDEPDVEVLKTFQGVVFDAVLANSSAHPSGLRMGSIDDVRTWKLASGRPKDLADVAAIDRLRGRGG
ncbi:MAG: hypothetical protein U0270_16775 [Labilithrix sp.]